MFGTAPTILLESTNEFLDVGLNVGQDVLADSVCNSNANDDSNDDECDVRRHDFLCSHLVGLAGWARWEVRGNSWYVEGG